MAKVDEQGLLHGKLGEYVYSVRHGKQFKRKYKKELKKTETPAPPRIFSS